MTAMTLQPEYPAKRLFRQSFSAVLDDIIEDGKIRCRSYVRMCKARAADEVRIYRRMLADWISP
jgi:hypothetical protein